MAIVVQNGTDYLLNAERQRAPFVRFLLFPFHKAIKLEIAEPLLAGQRKKWHLNP